MIYRDNQQIDDIIRNFIQRKLNRFYKFTYSYLAINKKDPGKIKIISNYPLEWIDLYKDNKFYQIDPVVIAALRRITPFSWDENLEVKNGVRLMRIFSTSKKYNIVNGFTFILHDCFDNMVLLSLLIDDKKTNLTLDKIERNLNGIQMVLLNSHEKILSLYKELSDNMKYNVTSDKHIFSKRENEILYWSSMGKTYHETALILNIKIGTVKFHMSKVVRKLGVLNAKHAIRLGIELNIVTPP